MFLSIFLDMFSIINNSNNLQGLHFPHQGLKLYNI